MNTYKQFIESNTAIKAQYEAFVIALKSEARKTMANANGQLVELLAGKNKGFKGVTKFIGLTKYDRQHGATDLSCLVENTEGVKVWTKVHNTKLVTEQQAA